MQPKRTSIWSHDSIETAFGKSGTLHLAGGKAITGFEGWANGHMESIGHVRGRLRLHDREFQIDSVDGMNRSWGPRNQWGLKGSSWIHITSGTDFGVYIATDLEVSGQDIGYGVFRYGFVVENGVRTPLIAARAKAQRVAMHPMLIEIDFEDVDGRKYHAVGKPLAAAPWHGFIPGCVSFQTLFEFQCEGRTGRSHVCDFMGLNFLSEALGHGAG